MNAVNATTPSLPKTDYHAALVGQVARYIQDNPEKSTSLLVPCHRVIQDGSDPVDYRWGSDRKVALPDQEHIVSEGHQD